MQPMIDLIVSALHRRFEAHRFLKRVTSGTLHISNTCAKGFNPQCRLAKKILIEDNASGQSLITKCPIMTVKVVSGK